MGTERIVYADFHVAGSLREPGSADRFQNYGGGGTPTTWVDGQSRLSGGTDAATRYQAAFVEAAADSALLSVQVDTQYDPEPRRATVHVSVEIAEDVVRFHECVIQVVFMEDQVASGARLFDHTVRAVLSPEPLTVGGAGQAQTVVRSLEVPPEWDPGHLLAVAWVHRSLPNQTSSREVLNAAQSQTFGSTPVLSASWGGIKALWR